MAHGHERSAAGTNKKRLAIVFGLTTAYLVAEVVGGLMTGSLALLANAGHMLTDVAGLGLALVAIKFAERPATPERTYGYYRVEILAALTNAVGLIAISIYILFEAWARFRNPPQVESGTMLTVAGIGLGINIAGIFILRTGSQESLNMKGAYFEVLSDMLTSVGVIAAAVIMLTTGWYYADPLISAGIGLFILPRTWKARPCWAALTIVARRSVDPGNRARAFRRQHAGSSSPLERQSNTLTGAGSTLALAFHGNEYVGPAVVEF